MRADQSFTSPRTIYVSGFGAVEVDHSRSLTLSSPVNSAASATLTKTGAGELILSGGGNFAGTVQTANSGGTLTIRGSGLPDVDQYKVDVASTVHFDRSGGGNFGEGGSTTGTLTLSGGTFTLSGASGVLSSQAFDALKLTPAASTIKLQAGAAGGQTELRFGSFNPANPSFRAVGSTLNIIADGIGTAPSSTNRVLVDAGLPSGEIDGWLTLESGGSATFATAVPTGAGTQVALSPLAIYTDGTFTRNTHVRLSAPPTSFDVPDAGMGNPFTIKSLTLNDGGGTIAVNIAAVSGITTLALTQGGLIKNGAGTATINGGTLASSASELNINVSAGLLTIDSQLGGRGRSAHSP